MGEPQELYPRKDDKIDMFYTQSAIRGAPQHTGYVPNILESTASKPFMTHYQDPKLDYGSTFQQQATIRVHTPTPVNQAFFSQANIDLLQDEIRYRVWLKSDKKHVIDRQREDDLKTIMRAYYLQYSENIPGKERQEVENLNERVLAYCVDDILGSINMYKYTMDRLANYPEQISRPINPHVVGTRGAEFKSFF